MSAFFGSTASFSKYQPRPQSAGSAESRVHVPPPSSERKNPPCPGGAGGRPPALPLGGAGCAGCSGCAGRADGSGTRQSITAYTRRGLLGATAIPVRPIPSLGNPAVSCVHVVPPSVDLKIPPPGPFVGEYVNQGGRRVFHRPAKTTLVLVGSMTTSTAPILSSLYSTFCQLLPPSRERNTPRSALAA